MISLVLKEDDLLNEIREDPRSDASLYKQVAITLAAEGHKVLLNPSDPSIISSADERKMSWAIVVALYRLGGVIAWDLSNELLDFDTMELVGNLYRHAALSRHYIENEDIVGVVVPPYYLDGNNQPVGYSRVAATNPPFYYETERPSFPWADTQRSLDREEEKKIFEIFEKKHKKPNKLRSRPKIVKTNPSEPPESDL